MREMWRKDVHKELRMIDRKKGIHKEKKAGLRTFMQQKYRKHQQGCKLIHHFINITQESSLYFTYLFGLLPGLLCFLLPVSVLVQLCPEHIT